MTSTLDVLETVLPTMTLFLWRLTHSVKAHIIVHVEAKTKEQHMYDIIMAGLIGGK